MAAAQGGVIRAGEPGEDLLAGRRRVGGDVVVVDVAGGGRDQEGDGVGPLDAHAVLAASTSRPPAGIAQSLAWKRSPLPSTGAISGFLTGIGPFQLPSITSVSGPATALSRYGTLESSLDGDPAGLVGGETHDHDPVGVGDEDLAGEAASPTR